MPAFGAITVTRFDSAFGVQAAAVEGALGQTNGVGFVLTNWAAVDVGATNVSPDEPIGIGATSRASVRQQSRLVGASSNLQLVASCWLNSEGELSAGAVGFAGASASNQTALHFSVDSPCLLRLRSIFNDATAIGGGFALFSNLNPIVSADWRGIYTNGVLAATNWWPYFVTLRPGNYRLLVQAGGGFGVNVPGTFDSGASYQFELLLVDAASVAQALSPSPRLTIRRMPADEIAISWPIGALQLQLFSSQRIHPVWWRDVTVVTNVAMSDGRNLTAQIQVGHGTWWLYRLVGRFD